MTGEYCPYDIIRDPPKFGLVAEMVTTVFGQTHVLHGGYSSAGTSAGTTVFLHGIGGTWSSWTPLLQAAAAVGHDLGRVVLFDLPGFGRSENSRGTLASGEVGRMVLDTVATIAGGESIHLVGQSMGGYLAADIASRHGGSVDRVTVVAGSFRTLLNAGGHPWRFAAQHLGATAGNIAFYLAGRRASSRRLQPLLRRFGVDPIFDHIAAHPSLLRESVRSALSGGFTPRNMLLAARNAKHEASAEQWGHIRASASFVWGAEDPLVPPTEADFAEHLLPTARRTVIADAAHIPHIEQPYAVLDALATAETPPDGEVAP